MEKTVKILLVEDDKNLGFILKSYLVVKGYPTVLSLDGSDALNRFENEAFDFVILDTVLPSLDGYTLAARIKQYDKEVPIVFISSKTSRMDVSKGFEVGADDFITKPFSIDELFERVNAVCKRTVLKTKNKHVYQLASYTFDGIRHVLIRNGVEKKLTNRELDLLFLFCEYKNRIVERSMALQRIWHEENYFNARNMDVYIAKIRKLFKEDPNVELENIHGVGYRLVVKE
ncbi:MAG: response regulator transcription factor [Bacteroidales bacterium]|jgi:DNA-binding response OmpR family regulator|nr:response regulator transcription factor [Bacteroidales bacterium]MBQ5855689.1 response regulator transcription factor [Bacteroidales bacterium]